MNNIAEFENKMGYKFKDPKLLDIVFTHRSYLNEHKGASLEHNERLEFLGDAVLELIVTEYLYKNYQDPEGVLTSWRSAIVRGTSLSDTANKIDIEQYIKMSHGELKSTGKSRAVILANAVEAYIGALYLDGGYDVAKEFVVKYFVEDIDEIVKGGASKDPKSLLQEKLQEKEGITPLYKVVSESGPDHDKQFISGVWVGNMKLADGKGASKQSAEQQAAQNALENLE